jgi:hypothetical protein
MFPRELPDSRLQSLSRTTNFAARKKSSGNVVYGYHASTWRKKRGAARIISFKTSRYRRFWPACMTAQLVGAGSLELPMLKEAGAA